MVRVVALLVLSILGLTACGGTPLMDHLPAPDRIDAEGGPITIAPITHGTVQVSHGTTAVLVDPQRRANYDGAPPLRVRYDGLPAPTLILVTDVHSDHEDPAAIAEMRQANTVVVVPPAAAADIPGATVLGNGTSRTIGGVGVEAVPMYNLGTGGFHTKGRGNGYVVTLGGKRLYFAGDTDCTPEMRALTGIAVAFLPMNLPYTMPPSRAAQCAKDFAPAIVYPYHYRGQDVQQFAVALAGTGIDVRLRDWYIGASPDSGEK